MERPQSNEQLSALLSVVSRKLGIPPETLRQQLESGKFDQAIAGLSPEDAAKFRQALADPQKLSRILSSGQAKALYEKLKRG